MTTHNAYTALNQADLTMHSLAQLLALNSMQWLPAQPDDSQANLLWNPEQHRLESRAFGLDGQSVRLVIDTATFSLRFVDADEHIKATFPLNQQTPADALAWWQRQMQPWGVTAIKPVNYQLTPAPVETRTPYQHPDALPAWGYWRTVANTALSRLNTLSGRDSEVRVWPHHFDTGVYYSLPDAAGQERAAIWAGYAIADPLSPAPYFYLSGYIRDQSIDFFTAPPLSIGAWRVTANWQGALLPISAVKDTDEIDRFLGEAYHRLNEFTAQLD